MAKLTGIVRITINGALTQSLPGATMDMGGIKGTPVTGHRFYGRFEEVMHAEIDMKVAHSALTPTEDWRNLDDAVITFETDTGVVYGISNAFLMETIKLEGAGAGLSVKIAGEPAEIQS